jgi:hypothetical protein
MSWNERNELVLQPKFQRRDVWTPKAKSHLIDTILRGLPIPIIFIRQDINTIRHQTVREVVDGQQRLRSVLDFSQDKFPVMKSQNPTFGNLRFSEIPAEAQRQFLNYEFSVVILEDAGDRVVLDIFARLNTYAQKLTDQELLNAAFYGQFKQTAYEIGLQNLEFWRSNGVLTDRQIVRMGEAELVSELLVMMLEGLQHRRARVKESYAQYDDNFPEEARIRKEFTAVIDTIAIAFDGNLKGTLFSRRLLFSSLFGAFYHVMYGIKNTPELHPGKHGRLSSKEAKQAGTALVQLEEQYRRVPPPQRLQKFIDACKGGGSNDRDQRITRVQTIAQTIMAFLT